MTSGGKARRDMDTDAQLETAHDSSLQGVEQECPYDRETKIVQSVEKENGEVGT